MLRNYASFYGEELLAPRSTHRVQDHPLSAARDCSFNIFATFLHIGDRSSILNLRTRHATLTATHLSHNREALLVARKEIGQEANVDWTKYMVMSRDQNAGGSHHRKNDSSSFERVGEFKYL